MYKIKLQKTISFGMNNKLIHKNCPAVNKKRIEIIIFLYHLKGNFKLD